MNEQNKTIIEEQIKILKETYNTIRKIDPKTQLHGYALASISAASSQLESIYDLPSTRTRAHLHKLLKDRENLLETNVYDIDDCKDLDTELYFINQQILMTQTRIKSQEKTEKWTHSLMN